MAPQVHHFFEQQARDTPEAVAVSFEGKVLSYRELDTRSNHLAQYLIGKGVARDTPVGIYFERSLDLFVATLGVLKAGGAYVPVDPAYPEERVRLILEDCGAPLVVTQEPLLERLPEVNARRVCIETVPPVPRCAAPEAPVSGENLAYLIYTSGSTGRPKGVAMTHAALSNLIEWQDAALPLKASGRVLQFSALSFDVSFQEMFSTWRAGGELIAIPEESRRDADALIMLIDEQCIERIFLPFVALQMLASASCRKAIYPAGLRDVVTAGERLRITPEIRQMFSRIEGSRLHNHYGPTETHVVTSHTLEGDPAEWPALPPIGRGIPGACIHLLDANHVEVPQGAAGELHVGGVALARGYWNRPELTSQKFIDDPFREAPEARLCKTGDMARRLPDGSIEFLDRADDQVKVRGFRVELGEIEAVLGQHPGVRECSVLARADEGGNKRLIAYLTARGQATTLKTEVRALLQSRLPEYMIPAAFVVLDLMPLTPNGKIDRKALPTPEFTGENECYVAPRTLAEDRIAAIWAAVLNLSRVGIRDDFFALGGDSLLATQIVSRVRDAFQTEVPLRWLFESPTVADLAGRVGDLVWRAGGLVGPALTRMTHEGPIPLSFGQRRLWFLDRLEPLNTRYNLPYKARLRRALKIEVLERSLNAILQRHQALRTRFEFVDGVPAQVIDPWRHRPLPVVDLSALPMHDRESELRRLVGEEAIAPFDLGRGPLFRACLFRLAEDDHVLVLNTHHIVNDGWSLQVLVREIGSLYNSFAAEQPSELPELPVQYSDFAVWQCKYLTGHVLEGQLSYWRRRLAGAPTLLELPTDRPRTAARSSRAAIVEVLLSESLLLALKALSRQEGATLYMTLLAAFQVLLGRYSGQLDFTVGMPIAGRNHMEIEGLIGFFVNMLVLRSDLNGNPAFRELLHRVRETVLEAYAHQDLPFERLIEELRPKRHSSHRPLCQVVFGMQDPPGSAKLGEVDLNLEAVPPGISDFELSVHMSEEAGGLRAIAEYSTELFDRETILRMLANLRVLLEGIAVNPDETIGNLPLLSHQERRQLLAEWNTTQIPYPRSQCIHQIFERQAERTPDAIAVMFGERHLTYWELNRRSNQLAHYLATRGVKPRDLVALCVERSLEMVVALLGILKAGAAYVPLDPVHPAHRLDFLLRDTQAAIVLTQAKLRTRIPRELGIVFLDSDWPRIAEMAGTNPISGARAEDLAYVMYTSGSTGVPKGVEIPHRGVVRLLCGTDYVSLTAEDVFLQLAPLAFDASTFEIWGALLHGARLVLLPPRQPTVDEIGQAIRDHHVTTLWLTAGLFHLMVEERVAHLKPLRQLLAGGDVLSPAIVRRAFEALPGCRLINGYGPTESTTFACCHAVESGTDWARSIPIGRPIANTQVYILDVHLQLTPIGIAGELCIGGDGLARGYLNSPELTARKFVPHPLSSEPGARVYRTGDLARYRPDGAIEFLGRIDNQVKIRGFRIELEEIEAAVTRHPDVSQCVVLAPDAAGEKRLVAYVVAAQPGSPPAIAALRDFLWQRLPDYMVPTSFVMLAGMPLATNGKIDRQAIAEAHPCAVEAALGQRQFVPPRSLLELQIAQIWERLLGIPTIGVCDNFFDIGGHSLLAVRVISEIGRSLHGSISLPGFFQNPTIEGMARGLQRESQTQGVPELLPLAPGGSPGTLFFLDAGIGLCRLAHLLNGAPASFATIVPLTPAVEQAAIQGKMSALPSLDELARAHAALVRKQQPSGPCLLAGHSFGGLLAFEVAHLLQREGRQVDMILLLDSWAALPSWWRKLRILTPSRARRSLNFRARHIWSRVRTRPTDIVDAGQPFGEVPWSVIEQVYLNAARDFRPSRLDCRGVLFRSQDSTEAHLHAVDASLGWNGLFARGLEIIEAPGDHFSLLTPPHLLTLAQRFQECVRHVT